MRMFFSAAAIALTLAVTSPASAAGVVPTHFKLANGLEVVVIPDRRTPVVTHMVWYRVGSADEPPGHSGIAHFLEHLMFKGTKTNPDGVFSQTVARFGGQENAFTSTDYTGYFQRVARDRLPKLMELEADRMTNLTLQDAQVLPERNVILEERNQRTDSNPGALLGEQIAAAQFLNHPYGRPIIGWRHEMEKLDREAALSFYSRFYTPNNAILVLAGDISPEEAKTLAEQTYGKVEKRFEVGPRIRPQEPPQIAPRSVTLTDPRVAQPSWQRSYLAPSDVTGAPNESEALDILINILGTGASSRMYQQLVVDKKIASSAGAWYDSTALDTTRLGIYATPVAGVSLPDLEKAVEAVLNDVIENSVTSEEIERAKARLVSQMVYAQDNQMTLARAYGAALSIGLKVEDVWQWPERVRAVTADQVAAAAKKWLNKKQSTTGYLLRDETRPDGKRS
ncbi:protease 3 precursor [Variibacter gotjawalensis]|uniref:Protease 3 n=1 Tax=Variibacter gotjawalensis TaxID=1333996 RepID=A0A0S3PQV2_9BRAD|nr:pitrilysin family protein [Variibacter gotjawalensis]NIK48593.1 zinc protease [Variibacter gotjawalensis]RZS50458.1 zinc protease [Variibacter gotjawalensis]BAT58292.1 protease 3 precursor [Variibacter gotjawalensis]